MLGKLFKHEFRRIGKMALLLILIAVIVTGLGMIYLVSPLFHGIINSANSSSTVGSTVLGVLLGFIGLLSYIGVLTGISTGFLIYAGYRFYKSMYSDEGYLTHTLPVKSSQVLMVKIVTAGICAMIITIVLCASVGLLALVGISQVTGLSIPELFKNVWEVLERVADYLPTDLGKKALGSGIFWLLSVILTPFANVCILFGALTIGQCSWKNRGLMGVIVYVGIRMAMTMITGVLNLTTNVFFMNSVETDGVSAAMALSNSRYVVTLMISLVFAAALSVVSSFIVRGRLNLE